jgi:prepilin-type N-terminal cleavage/methylation domain-containing protein
MKNAFTLVELAIVIVIIGLLVGGVLQGRELIEQAKIRSFIKEYTSIQSSIILFKDKYKGLPGDIVNGTTLFPNCTSLSAACSTNGNGNSLIDEDWITGDPGRFWPQLISAKMLPDRMKAAKEYFSSTAINNSALWPSVGEDNSIYSPTNNNNTKRLSYTSNYLFFVGHINGLSRDLAILSPAQAYQIDEKIDDALPQTGLVMGGMGSVNNTANCLSADAKYDLTIESVSCNLMFPIN